MPLFLEKWDILLESGTAGQKWPKRNHGQSSGTLDLCMCVCVHMWLHAWNGKSSYYGFFESIKLPFLSAKIVKLLIFLDHYASCVIKLQSIIYFPPMKHLFIFFYAARVMPLNVLHFSAKYQTLILYFGLWKTLLNVYNNISNELIITETIIFIRNSGRFTKLEAFG